MGSADLVKTQTWSDFNRPRSKKPNLTLVSFHSQNQHVERTSSRQWPMDVSLLILLIRRQPTVLLVHTMPIMVVTLKLSSNTTPSHQLLPMINVPNVLVIPLQISWKCL